MRRDMCSILAAYTRTGMSCSECPPERSRSLTRAGPLPAILRLMGARRAAVVTSLLALASCGRISFDATAGGATGSGTGDSGVDTGDGGSLEPVAPWAAFIGDGVDSTEINDVVETPEGDLWVLGTSMSLGPHYADGFVVRVNGETGAVEAGGLRGFDPDAQSYLIGGLLRSDELLVVGSDYDVNSQQPALGGCACPTSVGHGSKRECSIRRRTGS